MKKIFVLLLTFAFVFITNSCKKGEKDPAVTLKSRKSRLTGKWNMVKGTVAVTYQEQTGPPMVTNFELIGGSGKATESWNLNVYTLAYNLTLTFEKDGSFEMFENFNGQVLNSKGKWNFTSGVGKNKNKESFYVKLESVSNGDVFENLFNQFATEFSYRLIKLSNKEIIIEASGKPYMNSSGEKLQVTTEYVLNQS